MPISPSPLLPTPEEMRYTVPPDDVNHRFWSGPSVIEPSSDFGEMPVLKSRCWSVAVSSPTWGDRSSVVLPVNHTVPFGPAVIWSASTPFVLISNTCAVPA